MSQDPVRNALTSQYVQKLLKIKARQLARRPEFRRSAPSDLRHDLIGYILKQADRFDPSRACVKTFIARVVDSAAAMMCRERRRLKRAAGIRAISLEGTVLEGDRRETSLSQLIDETDLRRRYGGAVSCPERQADLAEDLADALAALPLELCRVALQLMNGSNEASVAREMGISRRQVRKAIAAIRKHLEDAGLSEI